MTEPITGRVLAGVSLDESRARLTLTFAEGEPAEFAAYGDCCSRSWIEHLTVPADIAGATILGTALDDENHYAEGTQATEAQYEESKSHREWLDVLKVYQESIATDRGEIVVEFRNDSNGYYGGTLERVS